jgi:hypothetical protein
MPSTCGVVVVDVKVDAPTKAAPKKAAPKAPKAPKAKK